MPRAQNISAQNNFVGGLKTEFTGLNFPENSCTETFNCIFSRTGNVRRRLGFNYEPAGIFTSLNKTNSAISTYLWNNSDGSGLVNTYVVQVGNTLHYYTASAMTNLANLSAQKVFGTTNLQDFLASGADSAIVPTIECQFATGNGKLFVFHPNLDPFYVSLSGGVLTSTRIEIEIRDFEGVEDGLAIDQTQVTLTDLHHYNLTNQGWYVGTIYLTQFQAQMGFYPANNEIWWHYKGPDVDDGGREKFLPSTFRPLATRGKSPAPKGGHILKAFNQDRSTVSQVPNIPIVTTGGNRPATGAFHAGRVFYAGLTKAGFNDKIYFSQIVENDTQYKKAYQVNDPTSENADLLPSDGGVISIQDVNIIHKLISIQNGLLVFASNGIWFITGSQGIGFAANDYTVTKISSIPSISPASFVSVHGYPLWWNEEGIYAITPSEGGSLQPKSLTDSTIASFYNNIPLRSKQFARGDYNPITTTIQWLFRGTNENGIIQRYEYDHLLNFDTTIQAFFPWTIGSGRINDVKYIPSPGGAGVPAPMFKYLTSDATGPSSWDFTFSDEWATTYRDWTDPFIFESYFITGYQIHGQAQRKFQSNYIYVFSDNSEDTSYKLQGIWDFADHTDSGNFSTVQSVHIAQDDYRHAFRKHKIRGQGLALQFKISSVEGEPFNIMGWSVWETSNQRI